VDMLFWAFDNPPPGNYLLISGDRDFSDLLHRLRMKRYNILLMRPSNASSQVLAAAAKTVWLWESIAAGDALRPESPPASSVLGCRLNVHNASGILGCKPNVNNLDPLKYSHDKILSDYGKGSENFKPSNQCRLKPLQKYVKKAGGASSPTGNQDQVVSVRGITESFRGCTGSEQDQLSVPSSKCNSLESVSTPVPLETPAFSMSSAEKHVLSTQQQQVEATDLSIPGEKPRHYNQTNQHQNELRAEFRIGNSHGKASNQHRVKPRHKYVKKTNTTFYSASNQGDSVQVPGCPNEITKSEVDQSPPAASSVISKAAKSENLCQPGSSTLSHSSAKKSVASAHLRQARAPRESILGKNPSISVEHASRNGTHGFNVSTVHYHPASQQSKSRKAQNKIHSCSNMGANNGKLGNGYRLNQQPMHVKKLDVLSASASNVIAPVNGSSDNTRGSTSSHPSQSISGSYRTETLDTLKLNQSTLDSDPPFSLSSAHKPAMTDNLHQDCADFIFGKDSNSVWCTSQNGTFAFGDTGHCHPTYQQSQSSLLPEYNISAIPHCHSVFSHSHSINSEIGSYARPSSGLIGVSLAHIQVWPSASNFQGLDDICHGISSLNISECSRGSGEVKPLSQGAPATDTSIGMVGVSGHSTELPETRSSFHRGSNTSSFLNHSNDPQAGQPLSSDYGCRTVHLPDLPSDMGNPGQQEEKPRYLPNSFGPESTIGHILHALGILKAEKIFPTEYNIGDCICYGDMNLTGFDVKKALELAIRHQAVVMKKLVNDMPLFVPKDESLWKCVNVTNSKAKNPIQVLDTVQKYISSIDGHSAIKNSQSRWGFVTCGVFSIILPFINSVTIHLSGTKLQQS
jgi:hypothetical protein